MRKNKKKLLIGISAIIVIGLIVLIILFMSKGSKVNQIEDIDEEQLEMQFNERFNNQENEYVSTLYHIEKNESGKYKIEADIPYIHISNEIDNVINKEINEIFVSKLLKIENKSQNYTILTIDYKTNVSNNIFSLVIRCILKEGNNAQRTIVKTYNYNIESKEKIEVLELVPEEKRKEIQNKINEKIQKEISKEETIIAQGFKVYRRDANSEIYILKNATEFYIENDILYIIYSYGNNNYTSELDLIISKV